MEKKAKILIVEDEDPLRELLKAELSRGGYQVQVAANGREGLERYLEECFNVVLLDVKMPEMGGVEVLEKMQEHSSIPEVIMFTGHGDIETAVKCIKLGAYDYLTKPVKLDELEMVIDKANEKNRLRRENITCASKSVNWITIRWWVAVLKSAKCWQRSTAGEPPTNMC